jgi:hypothetical protein
MAFPRILALILLLTVDRSPAAAFGSSSLQSGSVIEAAEKLKPGEFLWAPEVAPAGPVLLVVSLATQRAIVYRNGIPIGISTVSTGRPGHQTPTGVFVILQKHVEHYSSLYDSAPMPYMQRLTWGGVALHAGKLPGYPASHGCIRLPHDFARLLYAITQRGMTVVITERASVPRVAPADELLGSRIVSESPNMQSIEWHPERSPAGPVSLVLSYTDRRIVVLRNGKVIGFGPVNIRGEVDRTTAYILNSVGPGGQNWVRIYLPGQAGQAQPASLRDRIDVPDALRKMIAPLVTPGTIVIVTADSLRAEMSRQSMTLIETDGRAPTPIRP